jgi:hypothetical protein
MEDDAMTAVVPELEPTLIDPMDLVGPVEISEMTGKNHRAGGVVYQWISRKQIIPPLREISGTKVWRRQDVEQWLRDTNRGDLLTKRQEVST